MGWGLGNEGEVKPLAHGSGWLVGTYERCSFGLEREMDEIAESATLSKQGR